MIVNFSSTMGIIVGKFLRGLGWLIGLQKSRAKGAAFSSKQPVIFLVSHNSRGGVQELWQNVVEGLRLRNHEVRLMSLYPGDANNSSGSISWDYVVPRKPQTLYEKATLAFRLARKLQDLNAAVIVSAMPAANVLGPIAVCIAGLDCSVITTHHTPVNTHNSLLKNIDSITGTFAVTRVVVCVSKTVSESLNRKSSLYRAKRRVIHNALPPDLEKLISKLSQSRPAVARKKRIVATGRLDPEKNIAVLIRAVAQMVGIELLIVGDGMQRQTLEALAQELGVAGSVRFLGHMPRENVLGVMADCDIFTQPSYIEGHSLSLVEASKLGMPLFVSDVAAQVEGITDSAGNRCGIALNPEDADGFAREITKLFNSSSEFDIWAARSRHLGSQSSYNKMIDEYEHLIVQPSLSLNFAE